MDQFDLFEIMRTTRSMRRLKTDPVPDILLHRILEVWYLRSEWRQHAVVAVPGDPRSEGQESCWSMVSEGMA